MLSFKDLHYFAEVANCLSLTRASERLGITQPSLSVSIKRLEENVGMPLFIRHKQGVHLTQSGKLLKKHTQQLIQLWENIKNKAYDAQHHIEGRYTLGCHPSVAMYELPKTLPSLLKKHPRLDLKIVQDLSRHITEQVISLKCDVGIVVNPIRHPDLVIIKLREDRVAFWHNLTQNELEKEEQTLLYDPNLAQSTELIKRLKKKNGITFTRYIESSNLEMLTMLTSQKAGIAILPTCVVMANAPKPLKKLSIVPDFKDEICLIFRNENRFVKSIQILVDAFKKEGTNM